MWKTRPAKHTPLRSHTNWRIPWDRASADIRQETTNRGLIAVFHWATKPHSNIYIYIISFGIIEPILVNLKIKFRLSRCCGCLCDGRMRLGGGGKGEGWGSMQPRRLHSSISRAWIKPSLLFSFVFCVPCYQRHSFSFILPHCCWWFVPCGGVRTQSGLVTLLWFPFVYARSPFYCLRPISTRVKFNTQL